MRDGTLKKDHPCKFFLKGACPNDSKCEYLHDSVAAASAAFSANRNSNTPKADTKKKPKVNKPPGAVGVASAAAAAAFIAQAQGTCLAATNASHDHVEVVYFDSASITDITAPRVAAHFVNRQTDPLHLATANGEITSQTVADVVTDDFITMEAHVLENSPSVISMCRRMMIMGWGCVWPPFQPPTFCLPSGKTFTACMDPLHDDPSLDIVPYTTITLPHVSREVASIAPACPVSTSSMLPRPDLGDRFWALDAPLSSLAANTTAASPTTTTKSTDQTTSHDSQSRAALPSSSSSSSCPLPQPRLKAKPKVLPQPPER